MLTSLSPTVPVPLWNTLWNITTVASFVMDSSTEMNNSDWMNTSDVNFKHSITTDKDYDLIRCKPTNTESFNCSITDFLLYYLGSKQMPLDYAILVSLVINYHILTIKSITLQNVQHSSVLFIILS